MEPCSQPVKILRTVFQDMITHAREESPLECCGLLIGATGIITESRRMANVLRSPTCYAMDSRDLFAFFKEIRTLGMEHAGIYHSHPQSEAYPSAIDLQESYYPNCCYFIISLQKAVSPVVRAFNLQAGTVETLGIELVDRA